MWGSHCCLATALFTYSWNAALSPEGKKDHHSKRILRTKALPLAGKVVAETMLHRVQDAPVSAAGAPLRASPPTAWASLSLLPSLELLWFGVCEFMFPAQLQF